MGMLEGEFDNVAVAVAVVVAVDDDDGQPGCVEDVAGAPEVEVTSYIAPG